MNDIHPLKPPVETPFLQPLLEIAAVVLGVVLLAVLLVMLRRYLHRRAEAVPQVVIPPPDYRQEALEKLAELQEMSDEFAIREVFLLLSEIVREYLEKTSGIPLTRMTVAQIRDRYYPRLEEEQQEVLEKFLDHCLHGEFSLESHNRLYLKNSFELARTLITA